MKELPIEYKGFTSVIKAKAGSVVERLLFAIFISAFLTLLISQTILFIPSMKAEVFGQDSSHGDLLKEEEYLYNEGTIELKLLGAEACPELKVFVNGEEKYSFSESSVKLNVIAGDIIELDGSEAPANLRITVTAISENLSSEYLGKVFQAYGKFQKLFKI